MKNVIKKIAGLGIIPVVKITDSSKALPLAEALIRGGLPAAEITFRTDAAEESIRIIKEKYPEMFLGAGTVLTVETVKAAVAAGAEFIVAPGFNPRIVDYCVGNGIPVIPGINSPAQIEQAMERNLEFLKFFPAENSGGIKMLRALAAPYGQVDFMPTGGINAENIGSYLAFSRVLACGGSWMVKSSLIEGGKFDEITEEVKGAVAAVLGLELTGLDFNGDSEKCSFILNNVMGYALPQMQEREHAVLSIGAESHKTETAGILTFQCNRPLIALAHFERNNLSAEKDSIIYSGDMIESFILQETIADYRVRIKGRFKMEIAAE